MQGLLCSCIVTIVSLYYLKVTGKHEKENLMSLFI